MGLTPLCFIAQAFAVPGVLMGSTEADRELWALWIRTSLLSRTAVHNANSNIEVGERVGTEVNKGFCSVISLQH